MFGRVFFLSLARKSIYLTNICMNRTLQSRHIYRRDHSYDFNGSMLIYFARCSFDCATSCDPKHQANEEKMETTSTGNHVADTTTNHISLRENDIKILYALVFECVSCTDRI